MLRERVHHSMQQRLVRSHGIKHIQLEQCHDMLGVDNLRANLQRPGKEKTLHLMRIAAPTMPLRHTSTAQAAFLKSGAWCGRMLLMMVGNNCQMLVVDHTSLPLATQEDYAQKLCTDGRRI